MQSSFISEGTKNKYPSVLYIAIGVLIITVIVLAVFLALRSENEEAKIYHLTQLKKIIL